MATELQMIEALKEFDTPSITNVVATYPKNPLCLGLYNPWLMNWYTDASLRCWYPELGRLVGYAVTAVYGLPDPNYNKLAFSDVIAALEASPKPTIFVFEQRFPPAIANSVGLLGRQHDHGDADGRLPSAPSPPPTVALDIDEIRPFMGSPVPDH